MEIHTCTEINARSTNKVRLEMNQRDLAIHPCVEQCQYRRRMPISLSPGLLEHRQDSGKRYLPKEARTYARELLPVMPKCVYLGTRPIDKNRLQERRQAPSAKSQELALLGLSPLAPLHIFFLPINTQL